MPATSRRTSSSKCTARSTRSTRVSSFPRGCSGSPGTRRSINCGGGESGSCRSRAPLPLEPPAGENGEAPAVDPPETPPNPHEELTRRRLREALSAAIDRLPDDYRELISLRHYGEMPYEEIAELKGMPLGTVKNKLFRARQALRDLLPKDIV